MTKTLYRICGSSLFPVVQNSLSFFTWCFVLFKMYFNQGRQVNKAGINYESSVELVADCEMDYEGA